MDRRELTRREIEIVKLVATGLTNLEIVDLSGTPVSDVEPLAALTSLNSLDLTNTQVSGDDILTLGKVLPNCKISV